jgi:hypothetical protein
MIYNFKLDENEALFVIKVIGNLPTQSNAYHLWKNLADQYNAQFDSQEKDELPKT